MQNIPNNLTLRHLRAFVRLAERQSFVEAARSLHCTPSVLTENIQQLEQALGARLFDRTTRKVAITEVGRGFLADTARMLDALEESVANARAHAAGLRGSVRVVAIPSIMQVLVLPAVEAFSRLYPDVRLHLTEARGLALSHAVRDGHADIGFGGMLHPVVGVRSTALFHDELGLIAPRDHPLLRLRALDWGHLAGARIAVLAGDEVTRALLRQVPDAPPALFDPRFEVSSNEALAGLIERDMAVAILSAMSSHHPAFARLAFRAVGRPPLQRAMCLQVHEQRSLPASAEALAGKIREQVSQLPLRRRAGNRRLVRSARDDRA
ncbi:MAG: LysR family transcriptional regulator [Betaproteobacteria bacterium]|nr:LysR family transcriptional regulator [Betaproteobacteria bacterium]